MRNGRCTDFCNGAVNAGGGIYNKGILSVTNSAFSGNSASFGGVIQNRGTLTIMESVFFGNSAAHGGGIHNNDPMTVTNSTFSGNAATSGDGGGITNNYNSGTVVVMNTIFSNNTALHGGGIDSVGNLTMAVTNTTFLSNSVNSNYSGGGIYAQNSDVSISQSTFQSNSAFNDGGGIYLYNSTTTISNSTFEGNAVTGISSSDGGAIANYAIYGTSALAIYNSTFSANIANAGHGGAIHNIAAGESAAYAATTDLINSTIVGNNAQASYYGGGVYAIGIKKKD